MPGSDDQIAGEGAIAGARGGVLAEVAHEIRTPLGGILGMIQLMLDGDLDPLQRQRAETIQHSAEALLHILNDVLDTARLDAGRLEIVEVDFDLAEIVEDAVDLMSARARDRQIDLAAYIEPDLRTMVRGDPHRLRQVLLNLVANAIKFTPSGAVAIEVKRLRADPDGGMLVRFDVIDTGIGIAPEHLPTLFERFSQGDRTIAARYGGTGLGLAISQNLVTLMGGEIGVQSAPGLGSDFWFTIGFGKSAMTAQAAATLPAELQGLRALVVDAVDADRRITARLLEGVGLRVTTAADSAAAAAEMERRCRESLPYDLLVIDQAMPGGGSMSLALSIRGDPRFAGLRLALAASPGSTSWGQADFDVVIAKPIRLRNLLDSLLRLFEDRTVASPDEAASASGPRILLAEDNDVNQQVAATLLRRAGYTVDVVGDGLKAVEAARVTPYDLILMDAHMPALDGIEATKRIRVEGGPNAGTPIVALTANALSGAREKYLAQGMNDYLAKPFRQGQLLEMAQRWIGGDVATSAPSPA
jgi:CheY-like chemotaxis protein